MRNKPVLVPFTLLAVLAVAALACGGNVSGGGGGGNGGPAALFKDDFSDSGSGWDEDTNDNGSTGYEDDEYVIKITEADEWFKWGNANEKNLSDIHIDVTARNVGAAEDSTFGVMCHYVDKNNYYYAGIGVDGFHIIAKYVDGKDETLTKGTDEVPQNKTSYKIGMDCGNGKLALYVNGKKIDSVEDDTFTTGEVALFAWSSKDDDVEVHFDDFVVTALE
jgi:hypothetical protein